MEKLFGLSMDSLMVALLIIFIAIMLAVIVVALLNRIMLKIGLRNIPRHPAQTVLIVIGLMLSTLIISAAFGTGDTLSFSIRNIVLRNLGEVDEILTSGRSPSVPFGPTGFQASRAFGSLTYFPMDRFDTLKEDLAGFEEIEALAPVITETVPSLNVATSQNEGRMEVVGLDPDHIQGFGSLVSVATGQPIGLEQLGPGEIYINEDAAEELDARVGHELQFFLVGELRMFRVKEIVRNGDLAGDSSRALMPLSQAQLLFDKPDQINTIFVSNRGDPRQGADLSDEVTGKLRVLLTNPEIVGQLKESLSDAASRVAIRDQAEELRGALQRDLEQLQAELDKPEVSEALISLLADDGVASQIQLAIEGVADEPKRARVSRLFGELSELNVSDVKRDSLDGADLAASAIASIFVVFGMFSIIAGILLIFLIFVMLAAARKSEMGIARAVGTKRRQLIQAFVFEGTAYDLVSALVGVLAGIGVGYILVSVMARIFGGVDEDFILTRRFELRSVIVSYCLGMLLTFVTVFFSSYRVSRLNIVAAIRDLPEIFAETQEPSRLRNLGVALIRPLIFLFRAFQGLAHLKISSFAGHLALAVVWPFIWVFDIGWAVLRAAWPFMAQGWLTSILGVLLTVLGLRVNQLAPYSIGVTLAVIGVGLMLRHLLLRSRWPVKVQNRVAGTVILGIGLFWLIVGIIQKQPFTIGISLAAIAFEGLRQLAMIRERTISNPEDRNAFTFVGLTLLLFWGTPFDALDFIVPRLNSSIEMFLVSGISLVAAAVWTIIYNSDLLINGITAVLGRFSRLRPVLKTAVSYPLNARFRTGLTLAMFSLVIFTLIVMSIIINANTNLLEDVDSVTGGWDIEGTVNFNNPIPDIEAGIGAAPDLNPGQFEAIGGWVRFPIEVRQVNASSPAWKVYPIAGADDAYLENTEYDFTLLAPGFGTTKQEIWKAVKENPDLAIIDAFAVPQRSGGPVGGGDTFRMEGFFLDDDEMPATQIEIREPWTGNVTQLTVIAVLNQVTDTFGIFTSKSVLDRISPIPLPIITYRFRLQQGEDPETVAKAVEASFLENGMETDALEVLVRESQAANRGINTLLQGFMALGLLVGIAALGVISLRAVVERRQQIGMLRAIGFRRGMVQSSFLLESSFVSLLGIGLGIVLGLILAYNLVDFIAEDIPGLRFDIPWLRLLLIGGAAYLFSLITAYLPARQAAHVYPAEALRYE
ncbi:MAG: ABC transporter permease [Candidatus Bipolaricaulia bacterium]